MEVAADPDDLRRVVGNLIENAIVHNRSGGHVEVGVERSGAWSVARVTDDGPGIPVAERERMFERFRRIRDGAAGTGLGLAIVPPGGGRRGRGHPRWRAGLRDHGDGTTPCTGVGRNRLAGPPGSSSLRREAVPPILKR